MNNAAAHKVVTTIPATLNRFTAAPIHAVKKRRVAAYARVSTDDEEQQTSYENQVTHYTQYIQEHEGWQFAGMFTQLMEARLANHESLEYEVFDDYEVPLSSKLPMLTKPAVSIKYRKMTFSMASIRLFAGVQYVLPILNRKKQRLSIIPLADEESSSVMWARQRESDGKWYNREIVSLEFVDDIYNAMGWNRSLRYKAPGHIANSPRGIILIYELSEAPINPKETTEYTDPDTGEIKKHKTLYYPDEFKGRLGRSYDDYMAFHQQSMFDDLDEITGKSYSDVSTEPNHPAD